MFDIGFWELVVISIIALLVIGPERLPSFAKKAGLWLGKVRRFINNTRRELEQELNLEEHTDLQEQLSDLDQLMKDAPDRDPDFVKKNVISEE